MNQLKTDNVEKSTDMVENDKFLDGEMFATMVRGGAAQLRANAKEVNDLNVFPVPDGDTGDNMSMTIEGGVAALEGIHTNDLAAVTQTLSRGMLLGARGNSGVILSQFFAGMTKGFSKYKRADAVVVGEAMQEGVKQAYASVITPTEGTILTVAREAVEYAVARINESTTITDLFSDLIKEMYASLQRTPDLLAALKEANVIDSGGAGLFYIMQGFVKILKGEEIKESDSLVLVEKNSVDLSAFTADSEMVYGYCTELLLQLMNDRVDTGSFDVKIISDFLQTIGDSIVAFKTDSIVKIHVHTKTPEKVLEFCRQYGEFLTVKIENMNVQHSQAITEQPRPMKDYGTVAVAVGDGIKEMFLELGVDAVVHGGQTQNPSASDFLAAFEEVNARHIFVFPNNGNIIMAAKQAGQLYENGEVYVIESKDLGQGYAAISALNFTSDDPEQIAETLTEAMQTVTTGCISTAIRDAELNGIHIEKDDYIGFAGKTMKVSCKTMLEASQELIRVMSENEIFMITAFVGTDATAEVVEALENWMSEEYPDVEFYTVNGGQEVYPFIFTAE
ncbi:MAG: DAK2 domain-containing protein [Ruminococcaceae bacterium]|nr:DAK2 domain-containing protein [Oscillospiraceae bacterium]